MRERRECEAAAWGVRGDGGRGWSERLWRERFGATRDVMGRTIEIDEETGTIVGVMTDGFNVPGQTDGEFWWKDRLDEPTRHGPFYMTAIARLVPGVTGVRAAERLTANVAPELLARFGVDDEWRYGLRPTKDVLVGDVRPTLLLAFGAAGLVLLIAIMNVTNLLLARGTVRLRVPALRAAVGGRSTGNRCESIVRGPALPGRQRQRKYSTAPPASPPSSWGSPTP